MLMTVIAAAAAVMMIVVASAAAVVVEQLGWIVTRVMKTYWKISRVIVERHRIDCCRCCRRRLPMMMRRDFREENSLLFLLFE